MNKFYSGIEKQLRNIRRDRYKQLINQDSRRCAYRITLRCQISLSVE